MARDLKSSLCCLVSPRARCLGQYSFFPYVEDTPSSVKHFDCRLYADDTLLCVKNVSPADLQEDATALVVWLAKWGTSFNPTKCIHLQLGKESAVNSTHINNVLIL